MDTPILEYRMLTVQYIRAIKPETKTKRHYDERGMYLEVTSKGGMYWRLKYRFEGKEKLFCIGTYPEISLAIARSLRDKAREQLLNDIDPSDSKKQKREKDSGKDTFQHIAQEWMARQTDMSESTLRKNERLLKFAIDAFGSKPIDQIKPVMVLQVCRKEEEKGYLEQAQRIKAKCSQVFRYAIAIGKLERDPTTDLRGALKTPQTQNRPAITDINRIPKLLWDIQNYSGELNTVCGLKLSALTFVRPLELRTALWADIDFESAEWRYTPSKTRKQTQLSHIVSLSRQSLEILKELYALNGHTPHVFYSAKATKRGIMSENTLNDALKSMGYKGEMCAHGFRALAKTTLMERLKMPAEYTELQLAHQVRDIHGTAYNRTKFLDERVLMMQEWADYLDELRGGQIVQFPKVAG
jgi:integrase